MRHNPPTWSGVWVGSGNKIIGVTGIIGSGKSTVSAMLKDRGYFVLDADVEAKRLMVEDTRLVAEIRSLLGAEAYLPDGKLNREWIAARVFPDREKLRALNERVHPAVRDFFRQASREKGHKDDLVFWDVPLLFEGDMWRTCDHTVLVTAGADIRRERARAAGKFFSAEDFERREATQMPLKEKEKLADFIIDNSGTREETARQLEQLLPLWAGDNEEPR